MPHPVSAKAHARTSKRAFRIRNFDESGSSRVVPADNPDGDLTTAFAHLYDRHAD
jgi:hypothetical protein